MSQYDKYLIPLLSRINGATRIHAAINIATKLADDPLVAKGIVQFAINSKLLELSYFTDAESGEAVAFVSKPNHSFDIRTTVQDWVPDAAMTQWQCAVLNTAQKTQFRVNHKVYDFVQAHRNHWRRTEGNHTVDIITTVMGATERHLKAHPDGVFVQHGAMPDGRRIYFLHNPLSHQGGDVARAMTDFAESFRLKSPLSLHYLVKVVSDEYGVTLRNYRAILKNPKMCFGTSMGLKGKKPACTYRAALAVAECVETGQSSYIVQQDQTCSGFQHWSIELGCQNLATLTNLCGGPKQDLYTASSNIAATLLPNGYEFFLGRDPGKFFVLRMGYGSSAKALSRGLVLDKPREDSLQYCNEDGNYITGSLEKCPVARLNPKNYEYLRSFNDWTIAVEQTQRVSRAYYDGLMSISPKLQAALRMCKEANKVALAKGEFLSWTLPNGDVKKNMAWSPDTLSKSVRVSMKDQNGKPFMFSYKPMIRQASDSAVAPIMIHSCDGLVMGSMVLDAYRMHGVPIAGIHDSVGCPVSVMEEMPSMWLRIVQQNFLNRNNSMFFETMEKYEITVPKIWGTGWCRVDIGNATHHMG